MTAPEAVDRALEESARTGCSWRYLPTGRCTHAFRSTSYGLTGPACGINAWPSEWLGTGSQSEYERAATLPRCRRCTRRTVEGTRAPMHQYIPTGGVNQLPEYDPRSGDHYWIVPVVFRVACPAKFADASADPLVLDRENLVYVQSVGCFFCEEPYRNGMEHRRCPGEPR